MPKAIGIIPARYDSKRFPGKPLALIAGVPLVVRVFQAAQNARLLADVIVATDDHRISEIVKKYGGRVILTAGGHPTGTDRIAEAAKTLACDYVINIQGDEPFLPANVIDGVVETLSEPEVLMSSACSPFSDYAAIDNPNVVKVVLNKHGDALYFSRSRIPYHRPGEIEQITFYRHIGIYGFRRDFLFKFAALERSPLELCEGLEQLRALEYGYKIKVKVMESNFLGIDSPDDIAKAEEILAGRGRINGG